MAITAGVMGFDLDITGRIFIILSWVVVDYLMENFMPRCL